MKSLWLKWMNNVLEDEGLSNHPKVDEIRRSIVELENKIRNKRKEKSE